jgi:hypothetical protein
MHLVYFDESGNTGNDLDNQQQPILVVGALIVPETCWQLLEADLEAALKEHLPSLGAAVEIHGTNLRNGDGPMRGVALATRLALRDTWLQIAHDHSLKLIYRSIEKQRYKRWQIETFGVGVAINPQIVAFALAALVVNEYLDAINALGILIVDENKEVVRDVEKSIRQLRLMDGPLRLSRIIEKGFFIDSKKSRVLQLCDLCAIHARKKEDRRIGQASSPVDSRGIELIEPLIHRGNEQMIGVLEWLKQGRATRDSK